ncbi:MAG: hypothetical protein FWD71_17915 [Oscillospiraceae bacterium]|nr:hypothetical protein [Oscillospiraceae bacterium]
MKKCKRPLKKSPEKGCPATNNPTQQSQSTKKSVNRRLMLPTFKSIPQVKMNPSPNIIFRFRLWLSIILNPQKDQKPDVENAPLINPMDENYDGYYDDRPTEDNEQNKDAIDPELIKRVAFILGGEFLFK